MRKIFEYLENYTLNVSGTIVIVIAALVLVGVVIIPVMFLVTYISYRLAERYIFILSNQYVYWSVVFVISVALVYIFGRKFFYKNVVKNILESK